MEQKRQAEKESGDKIGLALQQARIKLKKLQEAVKRGQALAELGKELTKRNEEQQKLAEQEVLQQSEFARSAKITSFKEQLDSKDYAEELRQIKLNAPKTELGQKACESAEEAIALYREAKKLVDDDSRIDEAIQASEQFLQSLDRAKANLEAARKEQFDLNLKAGRLKYHFDSTWGDLYSYEETLNEAVDLKSIEKSIKTIRSICEEAEKKVHSLSGTLNPEQLRTAQEAVDKAIAAFKETKKEIEAAKKEQSDLSAQAKKLNDVFDSYSEDFNDYKETTLEDSNFRDSEPTSQYIQKAEKLYTEAERLINTLPDTPTREQLRAAQEVVDKAIAAFKEAKKEIEKAKKEQG